VSVLPFKLNDPMRCGLCGYEFTKLPNRFRDPIVGDYHLIAEEGNIVAHPDGIYVAHLYTREGVWKELQT
jgi:hypothetical protein